MFASLAQRKSSIQTLLVICQNATLRTVIFIHILVTKINVTSEGVQSFWIQTREIPGPLGLQISKHSPWFYKIVKLFQIIQMLPFLGP